jgi:hypothetical protein
MKNTDQVYLKLQTLKTVAAMLLTTQVLVACTNREVPVTQHEGPVRSDEIVIAPATEKIDIEAFKKVDANSLNAKLFNAGSADKIGALTALAPFILDRTYVENERMTSSPQMRQALTVFMRALVGDSQTKGLAQIDAQAAASWIERTRVVIESGCDGTGAGCSKAILSFFRKDTGSSKVMELSAREVESEIDQSLKLTSVSKKLKHDLVRIYYRRLKMAYELKNRTMDRELEFLYLARASQYAEAFDSEIPTSRERELLAQHVEVFETILAGFNPDLSNQEFRKRFELFVNNFGPWRYSRRGENPFGRAATRMLSLAAKNFLYTSDGKTLSSSLELAIKESQEIPKAPPGQEQAQFEQKAFDGLDGSFAVVTKQIRERQPAIWKNLALNDSFKRDEYFFLVDRVFGDHLTIEDGSEVWRGTRQDSKALLMVAEQYVKIQIAAQIVRTNKYMADIYSNRDWSSTTLLEKAIERSYPVQTQWNQLLGRIERIHLLLDRNLKSTEDIWGASEFSKVDKMFTSIRRNIKYLSVYPNMMLMAFYMAESKFKLPVYTFFGKIDIDTAMIIGWFFDGKLAPFFNFGNDGVPLKRIETLYAFLFALKTDTFASFSVSRGERMDVVKFFEVVIGKFLDEERIAISNAIDEIRKETRQNTMDTFLKTCEQDRNLMNKSVKPGTAGARLPLDLWAFKYSTYVGTTASGGHGQAALQFHNERRAETIMSLNSSLRAKLEFVSIMTGLLEVHMTSSGSLDSDLTKVRGQIAAFTTAVERLRSEYLTEVVRWNKTLSNCIDQAVAIEIERQGEILSLEEKHLRTVWAEIKKARGSQNKDALLAQLNKDIVQSTGASGIQSSKPYAPKSLATEDNYVYADLDVTLRMVQHMKKVAPNVDVIMPSDLSDSTIWKSEGRRVIPYSSSEEEFVRAGMKNFDDNSSSIMSWTGNTSDPTTYIGRLKILTELYKLGKVKIYDTTAESCKGQADVTKCPIKDDFQVTAEELVAQAANIVRTLSLTENGQPKKDTRLIELIGMTTRWDREKLKKFLLDENGDPLTVFETLFDGLTQDQTLLDEARDFNLTNRSIGEFLFLPEEKFREKVSQGFQPSVDTYFGRGNALIKAINAKEGRDAESGKLIEYSYELKPSGIAGTKIELQNGRTPIYLSKQKIDDFATTRTLFDRETGDEFNKSKKAPVGGNR